MYAADAVLLIATILSDREIVEFLQLTKHLNMTALIEVHTLAELDRVLALPGVELVGINNRNLQDFTVDLQTTQRLLNQRREQIDSRGITIVSESGLSSPADLSFVAQAGATAVLVGESLVKHKQPDLEQAVKHLLSIQA